MPITGSGYACVSDFWCGINMAAETLWWRAQHSSNMIPPYTKSVGAVPSPLGGIASSNRALWLGVHC